MIGWRLKRAKSACFPSQNVTFLNHTYLRFPVPPPQICSWLGIVWMNGIGDAGAAASSFTASAAPSHRIGRQSPYRLSLPYIVRWLIQIGSYLAGGTDTRFCGISNFRNHWKRFSSVAQELAHWPYHLARTQRSFASNAAGHDQRSDAGAKKLKSQPREGFSSLGLPLLAAILGQLGARSYELNRAAAICYIISTVEESRTIRHRVQ